MYSILHGKVSVYILYTDELESLDSTSKRAQLGTFVTQLGIVLIINCRCMMLDRSVKISIVYQLFSQIGNHV